MSACLFTRALTHSRGRRGTLRVTDVTERVKLLPKSLLLLHKPWRTRHDEDDGEAGTRDEWLE